MSKVYMLIVFGFPVSSVSSFICSKVVDVGRWRSDHGIADIVRIVTYVCASECRLATERAKISYF